MKVNKLELAPFTLISLGARGDVTIWLKLSRSFVWTEMFWIQHFLDPTLFWTPIFLHPTFFRPNIFLDPTFF